MFRVSQRGDGIDDAATIEVLGFREDDGVVGVATCIGADGAGNALWRVVVHDAELPGRWVVVSRTFRPQYPPPPII